MNGARLPRPQTALRAPACALLPSAARRAGTIAGRAAYAGWGYYYSGHLALAQQASAVDVAGGVDFGPVYLRRGVPCRLFISAVLRRCKRATGTLLSRSTTGSACRSSSMELLTAKQNVKVTIGGCG